MTYTEMIVLDAFRDAYGRMFTRGGEAWLNDIPRDAYLTMGDVKRIKEQGETVRVLEPQVYRSVTVLGRDNFMFSDDGATRKEYGYFYGMKGHRFVTSPSEVTGDCFAVSGTGADAWYKLTPSLFEHAQNWE